MAEKLTRKELRGPDAFQKAGLQARHWLEGKQRLVLIVAAVVLLGSGGIALASYLSNRGETEAARALASGLKVLDRPVRGSGEPPAEIDAEQVPFASEPEKDEAVVAELSKVRQKYPRSRAAQTAALPIADALLRLGRFDEALSSFQEYLKASPADAGLRAQALEGEGYAFEGKGQLDQALASFDEMSRGKSEFLAGMGLYHRARILAEQGRKQEAADSLAQVSSAFPNSPAARLASDRLTALADQGIKPAPPAVPTVNADAG